MIDPMDIISMFVLAGMIFVLSRAIWFNDVVLVIMSSVALFVVIYSEIGRWRNRR